ncbi:hypothetical protein V12B01_02885 [Vibrio splendidus 12B01]|nr:hypothetical protein V12B01_02885 [Vibrio splendidus 12B01]
MTKALNKLTGLGILKSMSFIKLINYRQFIFLSKLRNKVVADKRLCNQ